MRFPPICWLFSGHWFLSSSDAPSNSLPPGLGIGSLCHKYLLLCSPSQIALILLVSTSILFPGTLRVSTNAYLISSRVVCFQYKGSSANDRGPWGQEESQSIALFHLIPIQSWNWSWIGYPISSFMEHVLFWRVIGVLQQIIISMIILAHLEKVEIPINLQ